MKSFLKRHYDLLGRFRALYLISAVELVIIISCSVYTGEGMLQPDTPSYYAAYESIASGRIDLYRTPLYPLLIGVCRSVFGSSISVIVVYMLQSMIFLLSINWMGHLLEMITDNNRVSYWFTAVYALYPGVLTFCGIMMTESLAVSLVTAVLYLVSEAYYRNSYKKATFSGLICIMLWMLRPSLLVIPLLLVLFWSVLLVTGRRKRSKPVIWGVTSTLISLLTLGVYTIMFQKEYYKVGITGISTKNNYMTIRGAKAINLEEMDSSNISTAVDSLIRFMGIDISYIPWHEASLLTDKYGFAEFDGFVREQIEKHPKEILRFLYHVRLHELLNDNCVYNGENMPPHIKALTRIVTPNNAMAFLIFLVGLASLVCSDVEGKKISYVMWLLFALFAANYIIVFIGAPNDFTRLLAQNYPVLIAVSCWVQDRLCMLAIPSDSYIKSRHLTN